MNGNGIAGADITKIILGIVVVFMSYQVYKGNVIKEFLPRSMMHQAELLKLEEHATTRKLVGISGMFGGLFLILRKILFLQEDKRNVYFIILGVGFLMCIAMRLVLLFLSKTHDKQSKG